MHLRAILKELGYTEAWINFGIVTEQFLSQQYSEYLVSDDKNQEHYRHRAFELFIKTLKQISDEMIDIIINLQDNGDDGCDLSTDRIISLITNEFITDKQLLGLKDKYPCIQKMPIAKRYQREILYRKIKSHGLEYCFNEIQLSQDIQIQESLFEHPQLSRAHVAWLAISGLNKRIRNRAKHLLSSRSMLSICLLLHLFTPLFFPIA